MLDLDQIKIKIVRVFAAETRGRTNRWNNHMKTTSDNYIWNKINLTYFFNNSVAGDLKDLLAPAAIATTKIH